MKDQHTKIKGYRDLSQSEIDLMNEIKEHAQVTKNLLAKVLKLRKANDDVDPYGNTDTVLSQNQIVESKRCLSLAKTNLQQGQMWFVRAVALPESF